LNPTLRSSPLIIKVIFITSLIIIVAISVRVWLDIRLHEDAINRLTYEKAIIISEFIERNVIRTMERGRHYDIPRILKNFTSRGILKINVFKPDGTIMASTFDEELNKKVEDVGLFLKNQNFIRQEVVRLQNGKREEERIYYFNAPILNMPECFRCHTQEKEIIGVLSLANSLKAMDEEISKVKREAVLTAIITIGVLSSALGLLFLRFVNFPITRLINGMKKVEAGDLSVRVEFKRND
jgi:methyl-accepting chemotaxis protein